MIAPLTEVCMAPHAWRLPLSHGALTMCPRPCAAVLCWHGRCQQPMPFQGNSDNPPATPTDVYVSVFLNREWRMCPKRHCCHVYCHVPISHSMIVPSCGLLHEST